MKHMSKINMHNTGEVFPGDDANTTIGDHQGDDEEEEAYIYSEMPLITNSEEVKALYPSIKKESHSAKWGDGAH